jgi:uncharacterized surface protein with fasciclin (FAS1) repeats
MLMKKSRTALVAALGLAGALTLSASLADARGKSESGMATKPGGQTITQIVVNNDNFNILKAAVVEAGLDGVLSGSNQYTVFAPTDQAFINLVAALTEKDASEVTEAEAITTVEGLGNEFLTNVLLYHVTEGRRNSTSVLAAPSYQMLNNQSLSREELSEAGIASTDLSASNGVIHVINAVLLP